MRALTISAIAFGLVVAFGIGILVGRFAFDRPDSNASAVQLPPLPDQAELAPGEPLPDDLALPLPPEDLPPPPVAAAPAPDAGPAPVGACAVQVARIMPIRSFTGSDRVLVSAQGDDCGNAMISFTVQSSGGGTLYSYSVPAAELGFLPAPGVTRESLEAFVNRVAPDRPRSASQLPPWPDGEPVPALPAGVTLAAARPFYEAIRVQNAPMFCHRASASRVRCVAVDPDDRQTKLVLQEG